MIKFLNRPILAVAAILAVIFVLILLRAYITMIDSLANSYSEQKYRDEKLLKSEKVVEKLSPYKFNGIGPQLPNKFTHSMVPNIEITLGTFDALNKTCFLHKHFNYASIYNDHNEEFADLQNFVEIFKPEKFKKYSKSDTLGELVDFRTGTSSEENILDNFYMEIGRYQLYSKDSKTVEKLIYDMETQGIYSVEEKEGGTQFKLTITYDNDVKALFKPMRVTREQQALPNQLYFCEYERHTSEIAAFHLDRILGFNKALPVVGRTIHLITEVLRMADPKLQRTFFVSPKPDENLCFTGNCEQFCDNYHPICGNGTSIEGSFMAFFPGAEGSERKTRRHPWAQSYDKKSKAMWETDPEYCQKVIDLDLYRHGSLLMELIEMSIFDFLIGNMDRHNYQRFVAFGNDTFTLRYDHGRAFGKAYHDELKILAPLLQCCLIKSSTLQTLLGIHNSNKPLSTLMRESMANDPIAPILWEPHLEAVDRRLKTVLHAVRDCVNRNSAKNVFITTNTVSFD